MKIIRYLDSQQQIRLASQLPDGSAREIVGDLFDRFEVTSAPADVRKLLAPVVPKGIVCIGLNYRHHAAETNSPIPKWPVVFMKLPTAVQNPEDPILLPRHLESTQVDYECELAVVIGRTAKNVPRERALDYVLGFTAANDVSARDWQKERGGTQWCRGKTFDTFCPLGPALITPDEVGSPIALNIKTILNGQVMQDWNTSDMIFDVPALIEFMSGSTTLAPGTVILTGTPYGVGMARNPPVWLQPGDEITVELEKVGSLHNPVRAET